MDCGFCHRSSKPSVKFSYVAIHNNNLNFKGYFNRTGLFYGQYYNGTINGYNMPLGYLTMTAAVYGMFLILLVYR